MLDESPAAQGCRADQCSPERRDDGSSLPIVCVQGLGFVGAAVCVAIASARDAAGRPAYEVVGVDLPTPEGLSRIASLNRGEFPFPATDPRLVEKAHEAHTVGNLTACTEPNAFAGASVIIIDVPLDVAQSPNPALDLETFRSAIKMVGRHMRADALVVVETTVPPGATSLIVVPTLRDELVQRGLRTDLLKIAHCYERVMPGAAYLESIVNMPRVYAGIDDRSARACETFLHTITGDGCSPTRLANTTASELGKALENTYRAVTIALMEEFADFAEKVGVDLFEVVAAIRSRPTHSNMRTPGFGVGGYCITKDPLMPGLAAGALFGLKQEFPVAALAVNVNRAAPKRTLERLRRLLNGSLRGRRVLLLGLSYREDVGDTRYSPSQIFWESATAEGAEVIVHDPLVTYWPECAINVPATMPAAAGLDAIVLAVPHRQYKEFAYEAWLDGHRPLFLDAFNVLSDPQRRTLRALGCRVESMGRGCGL